ncbi:MAG TPA: hypothetical protein VKU60_05135 [Chloroflexota bacterium]|nr:hypothetical protein [Chloroflexota bacterium]
MPVCLSHGGPSLHRSPAPADELFIATTDGLIRAQRADGGSWSVTDQQLNGKHVAAIMIEPVSGLMLAGTHGQGLYASEDQGKSWARRDNGIESPNIYVLNSATANGAIRLYAGTQPARLYVSTDMGNSWQDLPALRDVPSVEQWTFPAPPFQAHIKQMAFDPRSADHIYVAVEVGGLFKTTDAGQTWRQLSGFWEDVHRVVVMPHDPDTVYISDGDGLYCSHDAGDSWARLTDRDWRIGYPDPLIVHPDRPELMFTSGGATIPPKWASSGTADSRIARSRDGAKTWEILAGKGLPEHIRGFLGTGSANTWPDGFELFIGSTDGDVYYSNDDGDSWSVIVNGLAPIAKDLHQQMFQMAKTGDLSATAAYRPAPR